jgi:hypothetical protein
VSESKGSKAIAGSPSIEANVRCFFYWPQERMGTPDLAARLNDTSIFSIVKAPLGWLIYSDGVKVGGCSDRKKLLLKPQPSRLRLPFAMVQVFKSMSRACPRRTRYREFVSAIK